MLPIAEATPPTPDGPAPDFRVREYARTAVGSHRGMIDRTAFERTPLEAPARQALSYLRRIEHATMTHLRNVLVTPAHKDARVTAFLTTWAYEKYWIADALRYVLEPGQPVVELPRSRGERMARPFRGLADRFAPVTESIVANAVGSPIVAAYVTIGAVDTWLTDAAYARIAERASHEELAQVLDRIRSIKERHQTFFVPQAEFRLAESASSRRVTRRRVARTDWPLRSDERPRAETSAFFRYAFDEHTDVLDHADARIAALPGLRRLTPLRARYEALR